MEVPHVNSLYDSSYSYTVIATIVFTNPVGKTKSELTNHASSLIAIISIIYVSRL